LPAAALVGQIASGKLDVVAKSRKNPREAVARGAFRQVLGAGRQGPWRPFAPAFIKPKFYGIETCAQKVARLLVGNHSLLRGVRHDVCGLRMLIERGIMVARTRREHAPCFRIPG